MGIVVVNLDADKINLWTALWNPWVQATLMYGYILNTGEGIKYLDSAYDLWSTNVHRTFETGVRPGT